MRQYAFAPTSHVRGFVLLGGMLVATLTFSFVVLQGLAHAPIGTKRHSPALERDLARAKAALIGYAASYAEQHRGSRANGIGPGYLPCPDIDTDGSPDPACPRSAAGQLPWRRLGIPAPTQPIGYRVADRHRANPVKQVPINTDVFGGLGPNRDAAAILEPRVTPARVVHLVRRELALVLEARAMTETVRALRAFRAQPWNAVGGLPWLRPPTGTGVARAVPGAHRGSLAVHVRGWFRTSFSLEWSGPPLGGRVARWLVEENEGQCWWDEPRWFVCEGSGGFGQLALRIKVAQLEIRAPSRDRPRTRGGTYRGRLAHSERIEVRLRATQTTRARRLVRRRGDVVNVRVAGVRYALVPGTEVAWWYTMHGWNERVHVAISPGFAGDGDRRCLSNGTCLRYEDATGVNALQAAVIGAGLALPGQHRSGGSAVDGYFERPRLGVDFHVRTGEWGETKNDRLLPLGYLDGPQANQ